MIALWALGANEEILNAAYRYASSYLLPAFDSPSSINEGNWKKHLGDEKWGWPNRLRTCFEDTAD